MKIDAEVAVSAPVEAAELAKKAEAFGFDCFWVNETKHDPFVQLALAASSTTRIGLGTSIALAFTRSPTTLAYTAWDLQSVSQGRLILGLGSQVKGHVERRFGMKWEPPAPKMKEVILAVRSVWGAWQDSAKLDFEGRFFRLDLMTPFFSPGPIDHPKIPVYVAGVNEGMCKVAGAAADGLHVHPLHTVRYLREVVAPAVRVGLAGAGRKEEDFTVAASVFAAVGETSQEIENVKEAYREQIAFYASTRTYRKVMELHGWGDVCDRLHALSGKGEWKEMASEITDEILDEFVVEGSWGEIGRAVVKRYGGLVDRARLYLPFDGDEKWKGLVAGFRA
ncbi:MAG: TIGR03617 family F420-dependent LLM class oxidoreductase [Thaumarchaeota archaeon]|nr:TIGR03617 family F420-dependent LLM class oxidoreductase [Nitrososphaerota archaeon]